ncbi:hypothetical protein AX774_g6283 [Zancudomyces culisetae]|uniref:Uncharacterized protein n=1 Tax=Zancudomyces culisetae TaxID=1213189 RepID=A0A1R1PHF3_ZANCU|nr:hypothetical protein AX774_g6283 [Zancudomyces culisetae]|eukprot:OMH80282.1 hypothetical protein AX774_g6283 [Zancudomyces culisetae]
MREGRKNNTVLLKNKNYNMDKNMKTQFEQMKVETVTHTSQSWVISGVTIMSQAQKLNRIVRSSNQNLMEAMLKSKEKEEKVKVESRVEKKARELIEENIRMERKLRRLERDLDLAKGVCEETLKQKQNEIERRVREEALSSKRYKELNEKYLDSQDKWDMERAELVAIVEDLTETVVNLGGQVSQAALDIANEVCLNGERLEVGITTKNEGNSGDKRLMFLNDIQPTQFMFMHECEEWSDDDEDDSEEEAEGQEKKQEDEISDEEEEFSEDEHHLDVEFCFIQENGNHEEDYEEFIDDEVLEKEANTITDPATEFLSFWSKETQKVAPSLGDCSLVMIEPDTETETDAETDTEPDLDADFNDEMETYVEIKPYIQYLDTHERVSRFIRVASYKLIHAAVSNVTAINLILLLDELSKTFCTYSSKPAKLTAILEALIEIAEWELNKVAKTLPNDDLVFGLLNYTTFGDGCLSSRTISPACDSAKPLDSASSLSSSTCTLSQFPACLSLKSCLKKKRSPSLSTENPLPRNGTPENPKCPSLTNDDSLLSQFMERLSWLPLTNYVIGILRWNYSEDLQALLVQILARLCYVSAKRRAVFVYVLHLFLYNDLIDKQLCQNALDLYLHLISSEKPVSSVDFTEFGLKEPKNPAETPKPHENNSFVKDLYLNSWVHKSFAFDTLNVDVNGNPQSSQCNNSDSSHTSKNLGNDKNDNGCNKSAKNCVLASIFGDRVVKKVQFNV